MNLFEVTTLINVNQMVGWDRNVIFLSMTVH